MPCIVLDGVSLRFRGERGCSAGALRHQPERGGGRVRRAARADRLRQELAAAARQRPHSADLRHHRGARRAGGCGRRVNRVRLRVPGAGAAVVAHRARQRSAAARGGRLSAASNASRAARNCWIGRTAEVQGRLSARTVRRHEAAGGDRAGARLEPVDPADGRAVQRARRATRGPAAGRSARSSGAENARQCCSSRTTFPKRSISPTVSW